MEMRISEDDQRRETEGAHEDDKKNIIPPTRK